MYADTVTIKWDFVQQIESSWPLYVETKAGQVIPRQWRPAAISWQWSPRSPAVLRWPRPAYLSSRCGRREEAEAALERL